MIAGLCVIFGALLLVLVLALGSGILGNNSPNTTSADPTTSSTSQQTAVPTTAATAEATTPATETTPEATGTAYPAQQYIDNAQMAMGVNKQTMEPQQPTTTFKAGSTMYVTFNLHPPSTGGAVCTYWYLKGNSDPITSFSAVVKASSRSSYTYAIYGSAGEAYVELYWASDKSCADKTLAQHVDFTVTAS